MASIIIGKPSENQNPSGGMFGTGKKQVLDTSGDQQGEINGLNRRIKVIEERNTNMRSKFQLLEQNVVQKHKMFYTEIKTLSSEIIEVKKELNEIKDKMLLLLKEMDNLAKKDSVEILKKYIDFWNPVNFVTKNDVEDIVKDVVNQIRLGSQK